MNIPTLFWKFYSRVRSDNGVSLWSSCKPASRIPQIPNPYCLRLRTEFSHLVITVKLSVGLRCLSERSKHKLLMCGWISGIKKWLHYWEKNGNFPTWWSRSGRLTALCRCTCRKRSRSWNLLIICPLTLERSISPKKTSTSSRIKAVSFLFRRFSSYHAA